MFGDGLEYPEGINSKSDSSVDIVKQKNENYHTFQVPLKLIQPKGMTKINTIHHCDSYCKVILFHFFWIGMRSP